MSKYKISKFILFVLLTVIVISFSVYYKIRVLYVVTGSMWPAIPPGSFIICMESSPGLIRANDILVYRESGGNKITAHRVIRRQEGVFYTKGDANEFPDRYTVNPKDIVGKAVAVVPISNKGLAVTQMVFLGLVLVLGTLLRKYLLFLRYGISVSDTAHNSVRRINVPGSSKKTIYCGKKDSGTG